MNARERILATLNREPVEDVDAYAWWPDPDRFDYAGADRAVRRAVKDYAVIGPWVSFFEIYCQLRGLEQSMIDLALDPDLVDTILDRIEGIQTEILRGSRSVPAPKRAWTDRPGSRITQSGGKAIQGSWVQSS